jgi:hypothetical protein
MDTVSKVIDMIYTWMQRNNREIEQRVARAGDPRNSNMEVDARRVRECADQNEIWMMIAKKLSDNEDKNIKETMRGGG